MNKNFRVFLIISILAASLLMSISSCTVPPDSGAGGPVSSIAGSGGDENIEKYNKALEEKKPILVDNFSPTCGPCKQLAPVLDQLEKEWEGKVVFVRFDVTSEKCRKYAQDHGIRAVPTLHFIGKDGTIKKTMIGTQPKDIIKEELENIVK